MDDILQWPGGALGTALRWFLVAVAVYLAVLWVALVAWAYRDIRQRSRDPFLQFISVILVLLFFLPGHWIYLILRPRYTLKELYERTLEEEALLQELEDQHACPSCRRRVQEDWLLCAACGFQLKEACEACERPLAHAWVICPYCGTGRAPRQAPQAPRASRPDGRPPGPRRAAPSRRPPEANRVPAASRTGLHEAAPPPGPAGIPQRRGPAIPRPGTPRPGDDPPVIDATAATAERPPRPREA